ncbi:MAG: glycosyltransferase family 2 protein [Solirubrobacteraceae bacterium]
MPKTRMVTVALPVLDGGALLERVFESVRAQRLDAEVELLVCDSGSRDGSVAAALRAGARVLEIPTGAFSHGGTRNLLVREAAGTHIAFLTQDAFPADDRWLAALLGGFSLAPDVALVTGPYLAAPDAMPWTRRELLEWFARFEREAPGVVRLADLPGPGPSPASFHTDANGAVARWAWERVPFREASYAEDQLLAMDMLRAGYAKVFRPEAAVVHSHEWGVVERARRSFDEFRGLREVYGHREPMSPRRLIGRARREAARDRSFMRADGLGAAVLDRLTLEAFAHHLARGAGAALGTRADVLPSALRGLASLEQRRSFEPAQ